MGNESAGHNQTKLRSKEVTRFDEPAIPASIRLLCFALSLSLLLLLHPLASIVVSFSLGVSRSLLSSMAPCQSDA